MIAGVDFRFAKATLQANLKKLDGWIERAKQVRLRAVKESAELISKDAHDLAEEGREQQRNPQGRKWQPLKAHKDAVNAALGQSVAFAASGNFGAAAAMSKFASDLAGSGGGASKWSKRVSVYAVARGKRIVLEARGPDYTAPQNSGAKRRGTKWVLPARRIVPGKKLPKRWAEIFAANIKMSILDFLRGESKVMNMPKRRRRR